MKATSQNKINPLAFAGITKSLEEETVKNNSILFDKLLYPDLKEIGDITAGYFGQKIWDITRRTRKRKVVQPRQISMYFSKKYTNHSLARIGSFFGGYDHATVLHAEKTVLSFYDTYSYFRDYIHSLESMIEDALKKMEDTITYLLSVDHEKKKIMIKVNDNFTYNDFLDLAKTLQQDEVSHDYTVDFL